ncbi:MAG: hypothetical protein C4575_06570 [Desulforudis sp.]|jgi:hypothetical protein|nr:MAG: hypothetical protein C4575_06570 [Desulforudis sp.]
MPLLDAHRTAVTEKLEVLLLKPPFSFFDLIESRFGDYDSIRRIFSLARSFNAATLIIESLPPAGIIEEENNDILVRYSDYHNDALLRLSFWATELASDTGLESCSNDALVGYAILKHDLIASNNFDRWHVFEAVFAKYPHEHNCVPRAREYRLTVGDKSFGIEGILYCQQNGLNKACAQVAMRSLLSAVLPESDISYRTLNQLAEKVSPGFDPGQGLSVPQIRGILNELKINFNDIDYCQGDDNLRNALPYQKFAYAGLESGCGALVGFRLAGRELQEEAKHIIPFYGHTFNKDTWVPNAEISYFHIGEGVGYVPSESWTSSFIGHDDNFGPNFCIPRLYIDGDKVDYVVELFRPGVCYGGIQAEAIALNILYSLLPSLYQAQNKWISRLLQWTQKQQVVFRAQAVTAQEFAAHLESLADWEGRKEKHDLPGALARGMPEIVWAVEISTPQLFPANERKLGEIVLDATQRPDLSQTSDFFNIFLFARLPGIYLLGGDIINGTPSFTQVPSGMESHTELFKARKYLTS